MSDVVVEDNKVVTLTYIIYDDSDSSLQEQSDIPVSYLHGSTNSDMFPKVAEGLQGHKVGDVVEITLKPEDGFGEYDAKRTFRDKLEHVPPEFQQIGAEAQFQNDNGETLTMMVVKIENDEVVLDGNHLFAGKTMRFKITIKEIRDASVEEIGNGKVTPGGDAIVH